MKLTDIRHIIKFSGKESKRLDDKVASEYPITLYINDNEITTFLCSPLMINELSIGFMLSEGWIKEKRDIKDIEYSPIDGIVKITLKEFRLNKGGDKGNIIMSGCGRGIAANFLKDLNKGDMIKSELRTDVKKIYSIMNEFSRMSQTYKETGGVHSSALWDGDKILVFAEDLGRHNAVDKVFGYSFMNDIDTRDKVLLTSGRISSEILVKCLKRDIPIIISRNAPTNLSVDLAILLGITLAGFVRGERMNIYAWSERII
ncbi:MAG: formate dehydrogenase accessory sulfurtransferase FdhD [Nitrospirota bacterium]